MNMQTGDLNFGTAAISLHQMAYNQIWHDHYKIPINNTGAAFSNSKMIDYQTAAEKLPLAMCSAISGANLIVLHGGVTGELAYNPILAVIDDDIAQTIGRMLESFDVTDDMIGLDVIKQVGVGGTFLNTKQTRTLWRSEDYMPKVFDKTSYQEWVAGGKKTILDKAKERTEEILATHKPDPLTDKQEKDVESILKEATKYYKEKGLI
jgi:trimethylamine--corrinoid protein Co-methyltransferase